MAENAIAKTFSILIKGEKIGIEIDYELTIHTKHSIKLKYRDWIMDIYTQQTDKDDCDFLQAITIRVMRDNWILFSDKNDDYPIRDTREINGCCYRISIQKNG